MARTFFILTVAALLVQLMQSRSIGGVQRRPTIDERISRAKGKGHAYGRNRVLMELDVMWDQDNYNALQEMIRDEKSKGKGKGNRQKRKGWAFIYYRWPNNVVSYEFKAGNFTDENKNLVRAAMKNWESNTCIQFQESTTATDRIRIISDGGGCWSFIGKQGGIQELSLTMGCMDQGTIEHELGHALGLSHEQARPDRDDHVTIKWDNIEEGRERDFEKMPSYYFDTFGVPYDYGSVMHYGPTYFAKDESKPTIVTSDTSKQDVIGQRNSLSDADAEAIKLMYMYKCQ